MTSARKRSNSKSKDEINLNWDEYLSKIDILCGKIKASNIKFRYIYGIPRGGLIPCTIISHNLKIRVLENFNLELMAYLTDNHKKVLLVDDIVDTGRTIDNYTFYKNRKLEIYVATIYKHKKCKFVPDFYLEENNKWVHFPYERD